MRLNSMLATVLIFLCSLVISSCSNDELAPISLKNRETANIKLNYPNNQTYSFPLQGGDGNYEISCDKPEIIETKMISSLPELGRDVALLSLCLGGINTVDIFELKKENYKDGIIGYKRAKTKHSRKDEAYIEMRVEPFIQATFDKYLSDENDEYLFKFHKRYSNPDSFNANVNIGIRKICADMGMKKEDYYCYYTFRHTWATIAQNDCDANLYEVAFGMNHSHGLNITRGYVKIDFTPAWELNAKVIDFIFFSSKKSKQGKARDFETPADKMFRITKKMMIYGRAYFKGDVIGEITDIGFSNVDQVIDRLVEQLPKDIPTGCMVQFRLMNCDSKKEVVYERSKGKGFM